VAQEPSPFERALRDRSWNWLLELRRRLKVDLVVVDRSSRVLLPQSPIEHIGDLADAVGAGPARAEISSAIDTRTTHSFEHQGLQVVCVPVATESKTSGALVVARALGPRGDVGGSRAQLETVASWLSTAVSSHLESPPEFRASGLHRVAPLARVLTQSTEAQSDRDLIRLFCQAMAVWHDIDVCAYVETSAEAFTRDIILPGVNSEERPAQLAAAGLPESGDVAMLSQGHMDRFGLPVHSAVYGRRIRRDGWRSWLLVFTGSIGAHDVDRLTAYAALLEMALALTTEAACTRAVAAVGYRLSDREYGIELRARHALGELCGVIQADSAVLRWTAAGRASSFVVTHEPLRAGVGSRKMQLDVEKRSERHYTTAISLTREQDIPFTPRDQEVTAAVAALFEMWVPGATGSEAEREERRAAPRAFDEVIVKSARLALAEGQPVVVIVVVLREEHISGATQRSVGNIRARVRGSDLAGMLAEGEIGVLVHGADRQQAVSIAERLRSVLNGRRDRNALGVGIAARSPGQADPDDLLREARANAAVATRTPGASDGVL
jgi:hypothetical protein